MLTDVIGKITIAEVILLFLLIFILPTMALLLLRLRKYEKLFGDLPEEEKKGKKKKKKAKADDAAQTPAPKEEEPPAEGYPFRSKPFLTQPERDCLAAIREALGPDVEVYPKVALWETVEPEDNEKAAAERLHGKCYDFLVCDRQTGKALTGVMFNPGRGRPAGGADELRKICKAAEAPVVFIDMAEKYDAKSMKSALGIPDLDL